MMAQSVTNPKPLTQAALKRQSGRTTALPVVPCAFSAQDAYATPAKLASKKATGISLSASKSQYVAGSVRQAKLCATAKGQQKGYARTTRVSCTIADRVGSTLEQPGTSQEQVSVVMKFGGSSVRDAERMREVAHIVCTFKDSYPCVVLSAMGVTTNNLLASGEAALTCGPKNVEQIEFLQAIYKLHHDTMDELRVDAECRQEVNVLLEEVTQLLTGVALMKELSNRTRATLVSFGERMSTRIFAAYLRAEGVGARQYDAWDIGFVSTEDNFEYGEVLPATYPGVAAALRNDPESDQPNELPIVTGFLAKGVNTGAITTLGRGGSDLSATVIGAALNVNEVQVWKDVDGVLTADPRLVPGARPVPSLTFEEATELAYFGAKVLHPHAMRPAMDSNNLNVRVKNSYNIQSPGTIITAEREKNEELLTSIVLKQGVTMLDIESTRMLGQYGFLAKVFDVLRKHEISVDVVATSEVSVSLTLDPAKFWSRDLVKEELESLETDLKKIARMQVKNKHSIISLIGNVDRSSCILMKAFGVLSRENINIIMMSQGASKVNISLIVEEKDGTRALEALHQDFFTE
mmetsp:Transcript_13104/g.15829  ORF Transcript_13104/g.15829 Transcript_13104/m.15829 type:complete len:578 (-) Transcript_13104:598-2331(-)|eukprot:CAMPEP_0197848142 /NCGR_PEP_ID=MMETSP1438-20131217/7946_1 /TAXON_ID=1461541 /ORGANISM="Pterosperma sp., Strain CCMP1384" /LENGTH=577 /DNA_ID=CAMNT_0043460281 /DNA_START=93 /DNA_END=1826 /DNA_ORIENTATION=-